MKKLFLCAAVLAAFTLTSCGDKKDAAKEGEKTEQKEQISLEEEYVRTLEAAKKIDDLKGMEEKFKDLDWNKLTDEQKARAEKEIKRLYSLE